MAKCYQIKAEIMQTTAVSLVHHDGQRKPINYQFQIHTPLRTFQIRKYRPLKLVVSDDVYGGTLPAPPLAPHRHSRVIQCNNAYSDIDVKLLSLTQVKEVQFYIIEMPNLQRYSIIRNHKLSHAPVNKIHFTSIPCMSTTCLSQLI